MKNARRKKSNWLKNENEKRSKTLTQFENLFIQFIYPQNKEKLN